MEKAITRNQTQTNRVTDLFTAAINTCIIAFSRVAIWPVSCPVGGLFVSAEKVLMPLYTV